MPKFRNKQDTKARRGRYAAKSNAGKEKIPVDKIALIPVISVIAVIPLIFRLYQYDTGLEKYDFFGKNGISHDFALHGKMAAFAVISACMLIVIIYRGINKRLKLTKAFIPLLIYAGLALLSSVFSEYQPYPFPGIFEQFEPCFTLTGYAVAAYYTFLVIEDKEDVRILITALAAGAAILVVIGFMQAFFTDLFDTGFGRWLTIPSKYYKQLSGTGEEFRHKFKVWRVFLTFSNPNYVGSYIPLVSPVMLLMAFKSEKTAVRIFYGALYAGLIVCLFGSGSKTGFAGLIVSIAITAVYLAKTGKKTVILSICSAFAILLTLYIFIGNNDYLARIKSVFDHEQTVSDITGIETLDDGVRLVYKNNGIIVSFDPERLGFTCRDDNGTDLYMSLNDGQKLTIDDERFAGITIRPAKLNDEITGFEVFAVRSWYFARIDGEYYYYTPYGKFIKHSISESVKWLDDHGKIATGRGFLWAHTLPLLRSSLILGSGADTFALRYPGADFVASYNSGNWGFIVTKPHCMYLQIAVQTGVLSLIAFCGYYFMFVMTGLKVMGVKDGPDKEGLDKDYLDTDSLSKTSPCKDSLNKTVSDKNRLSKTSSDKFRLNKVGQDKVGRDKVGRDKAGRDKDRDIAQDMLMAVIAGTAGYMTAAVFNDSSVAIAPVFWVMTGIGLGIIKLMKMKRSY